MSSIRNLIFLLICSLTLTITMSGKSATAQHTVDITHSMPRPDDGWYEFHEVEMLYLNLNLMGAEDLYQIMYDVGAVYQRVHQYTSDHNLSALMNFVSNYSVQIPATSTVAAIRDLYDLGVTPDSEEEALAKQLFVAVVNSGLQNSNAPLVAELTANANSYINNTFFQDYTSERLDDIQDILFVLVNETLFSGLAPTDAAGQLAMMPSLSGLRDLRANFKKHGCRPYLYFPFRFNPPSPTHVLSCGGAGGSTIVICGNPTDGCRKCKDGDGAVCKRCCEYFEAGPLCKRNCGDASIAFEEKQAYPSQPASP